MPEENSASNFYEVLGLTPSASVQQIRQAYRELSKLYHPDATQLPPATATAKFHQLNEAYATLSSPDRRSAYDLKIGYSRVTVIQPPPNINVPSVNSRRYRSSAYLDPSDRPLSAGEMFAVFILGVTFVGCLLLVFAIGMTRGDIAFRSFNPTQVTETVLQQLHSSLHQTAVEQPEQSRVEPSQAAVDASVSPDPSVNLSPLDPAPGLP